jgi:hypothetical protein
MNEKRFIQLINLYIDGEISPKELEELEHEVGDNERRREIYESYCRIQAASQVVYRKFGRALTETVDLKKYHMLARDSSRAVQRGLWYTATALAAACVTVVAAVSLFPEADWGSANASRSVQVVYGEVEVFQPGVARRAEQVQAASLNSPEPFFFAGRPAAIRAQRKPEFLDPARAATRDTFHLTARPSVWEEQFSSNSSPRVIRGDSSFDVVPELASFQFQR